MPDAFQTVADALATLFAHVGECTGNRSGAWFVAVLLELVRAAK